MQRIDANGLRGKARQTISSLLWVVLTACGSNDVVLPALSAPENGVPTDERPALSAVTPPPPLSGGTLLFTADGQHVIAPDPERDRVLVVSVGSGTVTSSIDLDAGDEPGRLVQDANARVHVVLRGRGELLSFSLEAPQVLQRRPVCSEPRGLAYSAQRDQLLLACRAGQLFGLDPAVTPAGPPIELAQLESDLRDVVITSQVVEGEVRERVQVTQFRSAEILELNPDFSLAGKRVLSTTIVERENPLGTGTTPVTFDPAVAWKAASREGDMIVVHQRAQRDEVDLGAAAGSASAYGAGECESIVGSAVTIIKGAQVSTFPLRGALPLDASLSMFGDYFAVVNAGLGDSGAPLASGDPPAEMPAQAPGAISVHEALAVGGGGCSATMVAEITELGPGLFEEVARANQAVAVAFSPTQEKQVVALLRDPAELWIVDDFMAAGIRRVALGGSSVRDTGHDLFHRAAAAGIACASCHPEGTEDGRTWLFSDVGSRRTQSLRAGLAQTAPFHWDGAFNDLEVLMADVFVQRMGGVLQSAARLEALQAWLFALDSPMPRRPARDALALQGRMLFESSEVGCAQCHLGPALTNNQSLDVGTSGGQPLQVPSLLGVAYRTPLMHDGCAKTLSERFEVVCGGGEAHGHTAHLAVSQLDALVAYMQSL